MPSILRLREMPENDTGQVDQAEGDKEVASLETHFFVASSAGVNGKDLILKSCYFVSESEKMVQIHAKSVVKEKIPGGNFRIQLTCTLPKTVIDKLSDQSGVKLSMTYRCGSEQAEVVLPVVVQAKQKL